MALRSDREFISSLYPKSLRGTRASVHTHSGDVLGEE